MADASQGAQSRMAIDTVSPIDAASVPLEYLSHTLARQGNILDGGGIRGTRSAPAERSRIGVSPIGGSISMNPSPKFLDTMLPLILGGTKSTFTFPLAEAIPAFFIGVNLVADDFQYSDCYVNRAVFGGSAQGLVALDMDILAKTIVDPFTFPTLTDESVAVNDAPYVFSDGALNLASSSRDMMDVEIEIDNLLDARFTNSNTATSITAQDRIITLRCTVPWNTDTVDLYDPTDATAITDGTVTFTNGNMSLLFTFVDLQIDSVTPSIPGKTEVPLIITARARSLAGVDELIVTSDSVFAS